MDNSTYGIVRRNVAKRESPGGFGAKVIDTHACKTPFISTICANQVKG
jgi:hypothetical protein